MSARAMILAAGYGTRLGPLTRVRPKPMLPVAGVPLVRWAALWLRHHGIRDVVVNLHHLGEQIQAELADGSALGMRIDYSPEHGAILGTGGGLRRARGLLEADPDTPIVVVNGKILVDLDLGAVLQAHRRSGAEATMVLRADPDATRWGSLRMDASGRVVELLTRRAPPDVDEPRRIQEPLSEPLMFTGIHVMQPRFLDRVPPEGEQCIIRTAYRSLFDEGRGLLGVRTDGYWWEHSTPERYRDGVFNVLRGRVSLPFAEGPLSGVHPTASIDPAARIRQPVFIGAHARIDAGAVVGPDVQLGARVRVEQGIRVERAVVWDDIHVGRDLVDGVLATPADDPV